MSARIMQFDQAQRAGNNANASASDALASPQDWPISTLRIFIETVMYEVDDDDQLVLGVDESSFMRGVRLCATLRNGIKDIAMRCTSLRQAAYALSLCSMVLLSNQMVEPEQPPAQESRRKNKT